MSPLDDAPWLMTDYDPSIQPLSHASDKVSYTGNHSSSALQAVNA